MLHSVVETIEDGDRQVVAAPDIWFVNGKLLWPPNNASLKRKQLALPESDWKVYDYKVLKSSIGNHILNSEGQF